jgi:hypothetical protein
MKHLSTLGRASALAAAVVFGYVLGAVHTEQQAKAAVVNKLWSEYDVHGLIGKGCDKIISFGLWQQTELVACANGRTFFR